MVFLPQMLAWRWRRGRHAPALLGLCLIALWQTTYSRATIAAELIDGIAAVVNGDIITISEVYEAIAPEIAELQQRYSGATLRDKRRTLFKESLQPLIDQRLQLARAQELNLQVTEKDVAYHVNKLKEQNQISDAQLQQMLESRGLTLEAYQEQIRHGLLVSKVVNAEVRSRIVLMEKELREAYEQRKERYRVAGELNVSHILFLVPSHATPEEEADAKQRAEAVLQKLRQGGDFVALAKHYSEGPSADRGGALGTFRTGELLPGFEQAITSLQPGEISDVVRTRVGWHIIRLEQRKAGAYRPFEEVKDTLKTELSQTKLDKKYVEWIEALRQQAFVTILYEG